MLTAEQLQKIQTLAGCHSGAGYLVIKKREKPRYSVSFGWISTVKTSVQQSQTHMFSEKIRSKEDLPCVKEDKDKKYLNWTYVSLWDLMGQIREC